MIDTSCLTIEVVFHIIHMKESILQEHLLLTGRGSSDNSSDDSRLQRGRGYSQEGGRPPERERYLSSDRRPPRRRGLPSNGRPPDRYDGGPPDNGGLT